MAWDFSNDRPIYLQIVELLERKILAGKYTSETQFPTVRELATEAAVNPNTMQKALQELERTGLIVTNRTTGRYVTDDKDLIENMRLSLARKHLENFEKQMAELEVSNEELKEFIVKEKK